MIHASPPTTTQMYKEKGDLALAWFQPLHAARFPGKVCHGAQSQRMGTHHGLANQTSKCDEPKSASLLAFTEYKAKLTPRCHCHRPPCQRTQPTAWSSSRSTGRCRRHCPSSPGRSRSCATGKCCYCLSSSITRRSLLAFTCHIWQCDPPCIPVRQGW